MSTLELLSVNEAIQILNRLQSSTANGAMFAFALLRSAEKHLNQRVKDHFAE